MLIGCGSILYRRFVVYLSCWNLWANFSIWKKKSEFSRAVSEFYVSKMGSDRNGLKSALGERRVVMI
jgi:hypothetical protein